MLERLYIDNYRCLVNFECRFQARQLILGPNGAGKSTLYDALALLRDFSVLGLPVEERLIGATRTRWQDLPEQTFECDVSENGSLYTFRLVVDAYGKPTQRPRVRKEEVLYEGRPIFRFADGEVHLFNDQYEDKVQYPFDWYRSALATIAERQDNMKLSWFKRWLGRLLFICPDPHVMSPLAEREAPAPAANLSNFASWYRYLVQESIGQSYQLMEDLRAALPGFDSMDLRDAGLGNRLLMLTFALEASNGSARRTFQHPFHELSDGQRVLIGLYTVLHFAHRAGTTLFFDEPDNFIALREIQPWLEKLLEPPEEDNASAQVMIVSHHPELLNRLAFHHGLLLDRPGGLHTRARPFTDPAKSGLPPAELVARGWDDE